MHGPLKTRLVWFLVKCFPAETDGQFSANTRLMIPSGRRG